MICTPIFSRIMSLYAEENELQYAVPGGLIGVGTKIDPTLTRADRLVGQVLGLRDHLPEVFTEIEVSYYLLRRLLGVKTQDGAKQAKVTKLSKAEVSASSFFFLFFLCPPFLRAVVSLHKLI